jgi:hypothetical protein
MRPANGWMSIAPDEYAAPSMEQAQRLDKIAIYGWTLIPMSN